VAGSGRQWVEMEAEARPTPVVSAPLGIYPARVDEKGRLKLPTDFQQYLHAVFAGEGSERRVFITSLDLRTVRIYPLSLWKFNENLLEQDTDDPDAASDVAFLAKDLGGSSEVDAQGRVLVPAELRQLLKLESQPVYLDCYKGRISVLTEALYKEKQARARENVLEKLSRLEKKGLR
jgi:MraZ protein